MKLSKISIVMPVYNGEKYLVRSIESFLQQNYENKELIIVDGKSTDNSHQIIKKYADSDSSIIWIKYVDEGPADATNKGIEVASGDIIGYLGCDDLLFQDIFNNINNWAQQLDFDAIYFDSYTYFVADKRCVLQQPQHEITRQNLLRHGTIIGLQNIFFPRHIFQKNKYNAAYKQAFDYEFYLAITDRPRIFIYGHNAATINIFDNNISSGPEQFHEAVKAASQYKQPGDALFYHKPNLFKRMVSNLISR